MRAAPCARRASGPAASKVGMGSGPKDVGPIADISSQPTARVAEVRDPRGATGLRAAPSG